MSASLSSLPSSSSLDGMLQKAPWVEKDGTFHETYRVLVFIRDAYLGDFCLDTGSRADLRYRRFSVAYFCPDCGEVWGRLVFLDGEGQQKPFEARTVACENHLDQWNKPGSLLPDELAGLIDVLPPDAVRREFNLWAKGEKR